MTPVGDSVCAYGRFEIDADGIFGSISRLATNLQNERSVPRYLGVGSKLVQHDASRSSAKAMSCLMRVLYFRSVADAISVPSRLARKIFNASAIVTGCAES